MSELPAAPLPVKSSRSQRDLRRRALELECAADRDEWTRRRRRSAEEGLLPKSLELLNLAQPFLPKFARYGIIGYTLMQKLWSGSKKD